MLMMTGNRPLPLGRKTSALSRAPSRTGTSRSFSITRSWRGCEPRWRDLANRRSTRLLLDLDLVVADEFRPTLRLCTNLIGKFLRRNGYRNRHKLPREHFLHLRPRQYDNDRRVQFVDDWLRCRRRCKQRLPGVGADAGEALLGHGRNVG